MTEHSFTKIRTARKDHQCTERSYHTIKAGTQYLYCQAPPWHEMNRGKKWWVIRACLRCASEFGLHTNETREAHQLTA
jgi:hypothetical protein